MTARRLSLAHARATARWWRHLHSRRSTDRLPASALLVAACFSHTAITGSDPEMLRLIRDLAAISWRSHDQDHPGLGPGGDSAATESAISHEVLVTELDHHIRARLPHRRRRNARVHTEPLVSVIDRLISLTVTRAVLDHGAGARIREIDTALTDLALSYDHLITELMTGRRREPRFAISHAI
ncbi:hypothetical protein [Nocardia brasiliensis]|uniref:hypothetical protein n=1 Tax=Nocardia brasiliensis TaxID=37326 RepID=UPI00245675F8|nr:hypothetical protein [Nocardia brasiliensis]